MTKLYTTFVAALCVILLLTVKIHAQQLTNLPTLRITTTLPVDSKSEWRSGTLTMNAADGTAGVYNGPVEIRGRGNSTWSFNKKPYRIKFPNKINFLGMPANAKNWVLLANHADKTLLRNALAFEVSKFIGMPFTCSYRFVDVYLNDDFIGNYLLTDQVETGSDRVKLTGGSNTESSEGFFVEADGFASNENETSWFTTTRGMKFTIKDPKDDEITPAQSTTVINYIQEFENLLFSANFRDSQNGYKSRVDFTSLVNWYVACEITGNTDSFWSTYMFKKANEDKLYFGPLWDFDIAFNNDNRPGSTTNRRMSDVGSYNLLWIKRLLQDDQFNLAVKQRWNELKDQGIKSHLNIITNSLITEINQSQDLNFKRWNILDEIIWLELEVRHTYQNETNFLSTYIEEHLNWLDRELNGIDTKAYYQIENRFSRKVMSTGDISNDKVAVIQKTFTGDNTQQWEIINLNNGFFTIKNRSAHKVLEALIENGQLFLNEAQGNNLNQQWRITDTENNRYGIINRGSSKAADTNGADNENGEIAQNYSNIYEGVTQQWIFTAMEPTALPIYTSGFRASLNNKNVELSWNVNQEKNGEGFDIQRSSDPKNSPFAKIGHIYLRDSPEGRYTFTDSIPEPGSNYYRLKMIDSDNSFMFSNIITIRYNPYIAMNVAPLPAQNRFNLNFHSDKSGNGFMEMYDIIGRKIMDKEFDFKTGKNEVSQNIDGLADGLYFLKVLMNDQIQTLKLLKTQSN
ncbi:CotH kinase family protein [Dyadobacter sp. NIV53]|uniref:CotH kinase family protein n=1 Tax=Dyadobacter sp. NIV53 TaxID=2861765 RepID=UPI001C8760E4|nr:CotH kinase family protein [Dyadobacter sp. NIV53]